MNAKKLTFKEIAEQSKLSKEDNDKFKALLKPKKKAEKRIGFAELQSSLSLEEWGLEPEKSQQVDDSTSRQLDKSTTQQLNNSTTQHLSRQLDNSTTRQLSRQLDNSTSQQLDNSTTQQLDNSTSQQMTSFEPGQKPADLKLNQFQILFEIYFKRPFKVSGQERIGLCWEPPIAYGTVRCILMSLYKKGYISKPRSLSIGKLKCSTCQVSELKCKPILGDTPIVNSQQLDNSTTQQLNNSTTRQLDNSATQQLDCSNKKERKILYNNSLSFFLENSDFWKTAGLTLPKIQEWMTKFEILTPEFMLQQLQIGEQHPSVITAKKGPVRYLYGCFNTGGIVRHAGFEFPEEKMARIRAEEANAQRATIASLEKSREMEREDSEKIAFLTFLQDLDAVAVAVKELSSKKQTPRLTAACKVFEKHQKIDARLEDRLRMYFRSSE